jgi:hypothetical protein
MGVAPSQVIRGMDIHALDPAASGCITKSLEHLAYKVEPLKPSST